MICKRNPAARLILAMSVLCFVGVAAAALKDKPPEGVALSGTEWQIDPYHSDDPVAVIEDAEKAARERQDRDRDSDRDRDRGGMGRGMPGTGGDDPLGRSDLPDPTNRDGGRNRGTDRSSTSIDPWGTGKQSASVQFGSRGHSEFLGPLSRNPEALAFRQVEEHVTVTEDGLETDCTAGEKNPVADSLGDGERQCGWSGRAWVIETTRGSRFTRTDRYELAKDGKSLRYTTTASGTGIPSIRITRMYEVARHPK